MNADFMTPAELRALADLKEKENSIIKRATLKHDLYEPPQEAGFGGIRYHNNEMDHWLLTQHQKNAIIEEFSDQFELVLPKGTPFVAYMVSGNELWYDDVNFGCEDQSEEWARKNLENFVLL